MDARTKKLIVVIHNHEIIYADKTVNNIVKVMVGFEPKFVSRQTLSEKLDSFGFFCFISPKGKVYHFYSYDNPNHKPQKRKI